MLRAYALMLNEQAHVSCGLCRRHLQGPHYRCRTFFVTFSNETVKALVGCMEFTIFLAVTIGVA